MPFRYDAPSSPFGATIAELLQHRNDASIRSTEAIAQIRAQAALEGARAWSGAVSQLGQLPLQVVKTMSDKRLDDAKIAGLTAETGLRQQALAAQQRAAAGQQALAGAMRTSLDPSMQPQGPDLSQPNGVVPQTPNFLKPEGNGVSVWDVEGLSKYMASQGYGDLNPTFVKDVNGLNEVVRTEAAARQATIRHIADMSHRTGNNPVIAGELVRTLEANQFYAPEVLDQIKGTIGTPAFDRIVDGLRTPDKEEKLGPGDIVTQGGKVIAENKAPRKTTVINGQLVDDATGDLIGASVPPQATPAAAETARHNIELERIASMSAGRAAASAQEMVRHNKAMENAAAARTAVTAESARNRVAGRPVLSSDANRITDIDTGIKEADALSTDIKGKTGTGSWLGANLPNVVTNVTGLGTESKQRQAIIDRVKQLIGKTLEGGVLRKEDEIKYEKILPTIGDPPDVAATKLSGLREMLERKRQTTLESLADAGFNTEAFAARGAPAAPAKSAVPAAPALTPGLQGLMNR